MFARYAIYYTPEQGAPLAEFGADWLGWDSAAGQLRSEMHVDGLDRGAITQTPRKYGFHGTIKPPFCLTAGTHVDALLAALADLCATTAPVTLEGLKLAQLGRFLALVPVGAEGPLAALAARAVQDLDGFRAPPTQAELEKRRASRLNPAQEANLIAWGYPHVLEQFRFHMTLTGRLDSGPRELAFQALQSRLTELSLAPFHISGLTLLGEDSAGLFHQIERFPLTG